jgi:hypothetical protein
MPLPGDSSHATFTSVESGFPVGFKARFMLSTIHSRSQWNEECLRLKLENAGLSEGMLLKDWRLSDAAQKKAFGDYVYAEIANVPYTQEMIQVLWTRPLSEQDLAQPYFTTKRVLRMDWPAVLLGLRWVTERVFAGGGDANQKLVASMALRRAYNNQPTIIVEKHWVRTEQATDALLECEVLDPQTIRADAFGEVVREGPFLHGVVDTVSYATAAATIFESVKGWIFRRLGYAQNPRHEVRRMYPTRFRRWRDHRIHAEQRQIGSLWHYMEEWAIAPQEPPAEEVLA